jgi:hypothetical protein
LIYCAAGNPRFAQIAIDTGFVYGAQLPNTIYYQPEFVDQNWENPNFERYMAALKQYRPRLATVLDLEHWTQLTRVIWWASCAAQCVSEAIIIIPKVHGIIKYLPREIAGKQIRLGYSVPTRFSGTDVFLSEFLGWPVHLLGGRPEKQLSLSHYLNVASVDGNYAGMKARRFCQYFDGKRWIPDGGKTKNNAHYKCFELSCANIMKMWQQNDAL